MDLASFISAQWRKTKPYATRIYNWWVWVPLSITASLIFSTGPTVQSYLTALITSNDASIYGSSFEQNIPSLPTLRDWFDLAFTWPHPAIGTIVVFLSIGEVSAKRIFFRFVIFGWAVLFSFDLIYGFLGNSLSIPMLFENLVFDFLGSIIASIIFILDIFCIQYISSIIEASYIIKRSIFCFVFVIIGSLVFCSIFYISDFFYKPLPSNIYLAADSPIEGTFIVDSAKTGDTQEAPGNQPELKPFSLVSRGEDSSSVSWRLPTNARVDWSGNDNSLTYDVEVSLFEGCTSLEDRSQLPENTSVLIKKNARSFSLWHDWGAWNVSILSQLRDNSISVEGSSKGHFWADKSVDGKFTLQQFVNEKTELKYSSLSSKTDLYMLTPLTKIDDKGPDKPKLHLNIDGEQLELNVLVSPTMENRESEKCHPVPTQPAFQSGHFNSETYFGLLGVRIIVQPHVVSPDLHGSENTTTIKGDKGWITVNGVEPSTLNNTGEDHLDLISISGNIQEVSIDGVDVHPRAGEWFVAAGHRLKSTFSAGHFLITGDADLLWINDTRASLTKWEKLPTEYKLLVITVMGSIGIFLIRYAALLVNQDKPFSWLEVGHPATKRT